MCWFTLLSYPLIPQPVCNRYNVFSLFVKFPISISALADMQDSEKNGTAICEKRYLNDIAKIYIYFGSPYVMKFKRNIQTTFTGKISSIGKLPRS